MGRKRFIELQRSFQTERSTYCLPIHIDAAAVQTVGDNDSFGTTVWLAAGSIDVHERPSEVLEAIANALEEN